MNNRIKFLVLTLLLAMFSAKGFSQVSVSFYANDANAKIGVGYEFNEKLWSDLRIYSGTNIDNITPEIVLNYNFLQKESYETYAGVGGIFNNVNGVVVPVGIGIRPFEKIPALSLNIEFNALYEVDLSDLFIRGFIGIRYKLN